MKIDPVQAVRMPFSRPSGDPGPIEGAGPRNTAERPLEVAFREFADAPGGMEALESILRSYCESMSRIAENMAATPEERRALEERRERLDRLREAVKEQEIDEQEARLRLERIMSEYDGGLAEPERTVYS